LKAARDTDKVNNLLQSIKQNAKEGVNLMPKVVEAVENQATLGEIADVLREVFGEHLG